VGWFRPVPLGSRPTRKSVRHPPAAAAQILDAGAVSAARTSGEKPVIVSLSAADSRTANRNPTSANLLVACFWPLPTSQNARRLINTQSQCSVLWEYQNATTRTAKSGQHHPGDGHRRLSERNRKDLSEDSLYAVLASAWRRRSRMPFPACPPRRTALGIIRHSA
jgi:hypothetical protein